MLLAEEEFPRLRIALERFSNSYRRPKPADKIIDLAICLEALFGDPCLATKGKYISEQVANLITSKATQIEAAQIEEEIRELYRQRNAIVHGEHTPRNQEMVLRWKDLVRSCLRQYLLSLGHNM